jgi:hypothetical protein
LCWMSENTYRYQNQVLAFQLFSFNNTGEVPIRSLAAFGGATRMRGYYEGRYKDLCQLVYRENTVSLSIKGSAWWLLAVAGNVGKNAWDYSLSDLKFSCGAGLRIPLNKKEKLNLRIDYGIGQGKNSGFYLQLGEAF